MQAKEFIWWLQGFIECSETNHECMLQKEVDVIKKTLQDCTCWEIEQGDNNK